MWATLVCPTLDIKRFLFTFQVKAKEDNNFFSMIWNKIKDFGTFILNLFSGVLMEDGHLEKLMMKNWIKMLKFAYYSIK